MKCPADGARLVVSERQGVEIDYCPDCRGVWLDRGELDIHRLPAMANDEADVTVPRRSDCPYLVVAAIDRPLNDRRDVIE